MYQPMRSWTRRTALSLSILALVLVPGAAFAQTETTGPDPAEAAMRHAKADMILASWQLKKWPQAARLLEQAATLRAPDDAAAVDERVAAAELFHFTGSHARAQTNLNAAAQQALADGRVYDAAQYLVKAASIAKERGSLEDAIGYARSAERLARSPHLTAAEYQAIKDAIVWLPEAQMARVEP